MSAGRLLNRRVKSVVLAGLLLASIFFAFNFFSESVVSGQDAYIPKTPVMQQMIKSTNELRAQKGLQPLAASKLLEDSATNKLTDMQNNDYWGHYAPSGTSFSSFIWDQDDTAANVGENLARCFPSYDAAFAGLVASPKHYAVLTGDFSYIGIASQITATGCESIVMHVSD